MVAQLVKEVIVLDGTLKVAAQFTVSDVCRNFGEKLLNGDRGKLSHYSD
jgi:hypothetical protein